MTGFNFYVTLLFGILIGVAFGIFVGMWAPPATFRIPDACSGQAFWCWLDKWQTLVAGSFAFGAAAIAWHSVDRQINANRESAEENTKATTDAADRQIGEIQRQFTSIERRSLLRRKVEINFLQITISRLEKDHRTLVAAFEQGNEITTKQVVAARRPDFPPLEIFTSFLLTSTIIGLNDISVHLRQFDKNTLPIVEAGDVTLERIKKMVAIARDTQRRVDTTQDNLLAELKLLGREEAQLAK